MQLREIEIAGYRSLERVELKNLTQFNVLIGRNNSGKSAVFGAVDLLNRSIQGLEVPWNRVLTGLDKNCALEMRLRFNVLPEERAEFCGHLSSGGVQESRCAHLYQGCFLNQVEYVFKAPERNPSVISIHETRFRAEDGQWAVVQRITGGHATEHPTSRVIPFTPLASSEPALPASAFDLDGGMSEQVNIPRVRRDRGEFHADPTVRWPLDALTGYLSSAYFFSPFRHSPSTIAISDSMTLLQDGSNLAATLHALLGNNRPVFYAIQQFVQAALPDVGMLHSPVRGNQTTEVGFRIPEIEDPIPLQDMGAGVEQLLMIATVLHTTKPDQPLFVEEPETHLHAGAQRFLIERLRQDGRQVFITTHSPTFVNLDGPGSVYQVTYEDRRTRIRPLAEPASLGQALADIGARNSDVLLSDAVLFVEGRADRGVFDAWSQKLGKSLEQHNITVLSMGGGEFADRQAPVRSELLEGISRQAPVPHLFVIDRDERSPSEISKLQERLGDGMHVLARRELENYLLVPRALLAALREKCHQDPAALAALEATSADEITELIKTKADSLRARVLLKRIRAELPGLRGGLLPRECLEELEADALEEQFAERLEARLRQRLTDHVDRLHLAELVRRQRESLDNEWADPTCHVHLAPGEELIDAVFQQFGRQYKKQTDAVRIADCMQPEEIPDEIKELLDKVIVLTGRT